MQNDYNLSINAIDTKQASSSAWTFFFLLTTLAALTSTYWFYTQTNKNQVKQDQFTAQKENLSSKIKILESEIQQQQETHRQLINDKSKLQSQFQLQQQEIKNLKLQQQLTNKESAAKSQKTIAALQKKITQTEESSLKQLNRLKEFNQQLIESVDMVESYQQEKAELQEKLTRLQEQYQTLFTDKATISKEFEQYKALQTSKEQSYLKKLSLSQEQYTEDAELFKKLLSDSNLHIKNLRNRFTVIELGQDIMYDAGGADLTIAGQKSLNQLAAILKQYPNRQIAVQGHSDNRPIGKTLKEKYYSNWELSSARAASAIRYLQYNSLIKPERLILVAYGSYQPKIISDKDEDLARNRRIEIILLPKDFQFFKQSMPVKESH